MSQIVYIVTQGEYSDYGIQAVFLDKQAAEAYVKVFGGDIEEWEVGKIEHVVTPLWHLCFKKIDGKITENCYMNVKVFSAENPKTEEFPGFLSIYVRAQTLEQAFKIACDKRAAIIAEKEGL